MENFVLLTIRSAKVQSEHDRLGTIFKGLLDGWQGSINACCVRGDAKVLLVLWYIEDHMDGNLFALEATWSIFSLLRLWSFLAVAGALPLALATSVAMCLIRPRLTSVS